MCNFEVPFENITTTVTIFKQRQAHFQKAVWIILFLLCRRYRNEQLLKFQAMELLLLSSASEKIFKFYP